MFGETMQDGSSKRTMQRKEDDSNSLVTIGRWNDLDTDILGKIFKYFDYLHYEKPEDVSACQVSALVHSSAVCSAWGSVLCDPRLWNTLDLSNMKSNFIRTIQPPYIHVNSRSDEAFSLVLKASLSLSRRNVTTLIFHPQLYVSDDQLVYTARRCPNLKRLILPGGNRIKKTGFREAIRNWKDLESLTIPSLMHPPSIIEEISVSCRNFSELKITGCFDVRFASTLVGSHLPNLKVLSLRCSLIVRDALITLLDDLAQLEVLNISHCVLLSEPPRPDKPLQIVQELDEVIFERAARLQRFITCQQIAPCIMCQRATFYEGNVKWCKYEEGLWKQDELKLKSCTEVYDGRRPLKKNKIGTSTMDEEGDSIRREDLPSDVLRKIFELFNDTSDLTWAIAKIHCSAVCRAWRSILSDPLLWHTIDLSTMESDFIRINFEPYVWVSTRTEERLNCFLKSALSLSKGNIISLIFNLDLYVPDHLFTYTAERSRNLKRLVMPVWNRIQKVGIGKAIACWKDLESLTIGNIEFDNCLYLMSQISYNCKNLRELKLIGTCQLFAFILVTYLPKLRVLSLRCWKLSEEDLVAILDGLPDLEVLNISHCFVIRAPPERGVITQLDPVILGKASRLRRFITCMEFQSCIMCKRAREDEGIVRWYKYEQGQWKQDEVNSLAL